MENCILKDFGNMNREFGAMVEKGQRAKSTYNKYLAVYNHFKTFLWEKKKRTDMAYKELTKEIITDFDKYLRVEKGLSANTLWIYTMPLLSLTDKAWRRGIVRTDPFREYSLEMQETDRGYLTEEELRTLANAVFVKKQTSLVRDMFLFGCFTGLSYIDIKTLTHDKIQRMDFDGEEWIITRRTKTRVSSNVPLMEIAKELIERYRGLAGGDLVFPMPSNSVCNTHLKRIAKACGIHKEIGFHLSRHTFATTVYLCNGGTIEALSKILGHKHISTTQIYAEVTNRMVSSDFRAISGNLAAMQRSVLEKKDRKQDGKRVRRSLRETA